MTASKKLTSGVCVTGQFFPRQLFQESRYARPINSKLLRVVRTGLSTGQSHSSYPTNTIKELKATKN